MVMIGELQSTVVMLTYLIVDASGREPFWHVKGVSSCWKAEGPSIIGFPAIVTFARPGPYCIMDRPSTFSRFWFPCMTMETGGQVSPVKSARPLNPVFILQPGVWVKKE